MFLFAWAGSDEPVGSWLGPLGLVETPQEHDRDGQEPQMQKLRGLIVDEKWASDVIELE
jgi:hypothetical protein